MTALWTLLLLAGLLWPGRVLSALDGMPLSGRAEAVLIGLVVPVLWWLDRGFLSRTAVRASIALLLSLKLLSWVALPQHGLCARFSTTAPFNGLSGTMPIDEPTGSLRSWDLRADWRAAAPRCTAILDRPYRSASELPVWFFNILDAVRPGRNGLALDVTGHLSVDDAGSFVLETGPDMLVTGRVDDTRVSPPRGAPIVVPLPPGTHVIDLHVSFMGERWKFVPLWNGRDAWTSARLTASARSSPPSLADGILTRPLAAATPTIILLIVSAWSLSALASLQLSTAMAIWALVMSVLLAWLGVYQRFDRTSGPLLLGSVLVPVATRNRNMRGAFVLVGIPWLAFFVGHSWQQIGMAASYSIGDDWHVYQSAAYRIFMNGYWLEGGSQTFIFQPLYRWTVGVLHLLFGDSNVGEVYLDAACLLFAALACFAIVKHAAGFYWALAAASMTLATFTVSTTWHLIGRGLSEITATGWMSLTAVFLLRARVGRSSAALTAGVFAVLMFYTRLNQLLLAGFLLALLLPIRTQARRSEAWRALRHINVRSAAIYAVTLAAGVALFAARTWWYTGRFSVLYGTSFPVQETGLRLTTIGSPGVWAQISTNLRSVVSMNDPPSLDPRAVLVALGVLLSLLALIQVPYVNRLPLSIALATTGALAQSFVAHTHQYPGRMSVHLVPLAVATTVCAASQLVRSRTSPGRAFRRATQVPAGCTPPGAIF